MKIKSEVKEVVLFSELPDYVKDNATRKVVKRSEMKSIQKDFSLDSEVHEDYV